MSRETPLSRDDNDFYEAMKDSSPAIGRYVLTKLHDGRDPRDIARLLESEAETARGWCIGRFGSALHQ